MLLRVEQKTILPPKAKYEDFTSYVPIEYRDKHAQALNRIEIEWFCKNEIRDVTLIHLN